MPASSTLDDHPARQRARGEILSRFKELSWQDQYKIYEFVQGHFIHSGPGSEALREVRERADCVKAVVKVAKHLGMAEGEVPGVQEYEQARKGLGIELSAATIIRRWVVWREVAKAARGEKVSMTARQRAHFRAAIRQKPEGEEWLHGLREWLGTRPSASARWDDYDAWAEERNEKLPDLPPVPNARNVSRALDIPWVVARRVAERDLSLVEAQAQHLEHLKKEGSGFVGVLFVSLLHEVTEGRGQGLTRTAGFPAFAFEMGAARQAWHLSDVEAHHKGRPFPARAPGELQDKVLIGAQVHQLCGLTSVQASEAIQKERLTIPRPAGRVSGRHYWWRREVEKWVAENPERAPGLCCSEVGRHRRAAR